MYVSKTNMNDHKHCVNFVIWNRGSILAAFGYAANGELNKTPIALPYVLRDGAQLNTNLPDCLDQAVVEARDKFKCNIEEGYNYYLLTSGDSAREVHHVTSFTNHACIGNVNNPKQAYGFRSDEQLTDNCTTRFVDAVALYHMLLATDNPQYKIIENIVHRRKEYSGR